MHRAWPRLGAQEPKRSWEEGSDLTTVSKAQCEKNRAQGKALSVLQESVGWVDGADGKAEKKRTFSSLVTIEERR